MIASRGYTLDELSWCARELPFDMQVAESQQYKTPNAYWLLPHIERIIVRSRQIRRQLTDMILTEKDIGFLLRDAPELSRGDFHRAGYTAQDEPLYRYRPGCPVSAEAQAMQKLWGRA